MRSCGRLLGCTAVCSAGCAASSVQSPADRAPIEYRQTNASFELVFDAALEALFDQGFLVRLCDRRSGLIVGELPTSNGRRPESAQATLDRQAAAMQAGSDICIHVPPGKREIRTTAFRDGHAVDGRITAFYEGLGRQTALKPWAGTVSPTR